MSGVGDIPEPVRRAIEARFDDIAREDQVRILFACESGSRAWGFESSDSDFDVRFIYIRNEDWYVSIDVERRKDVIERPIDDELDINGWDLRKALQLMGKSNPPLLEWLGSPIVYREIQPFTNELRELSKPFYSPRACLYHYLSMAKGNVREYLKGEEVRRKKYLYVLRPLLAVRWIEEFEGMPPTEFDKLVQAVVDDDALKNAIDGLVEQKRRGQEMDWGPRIPELTEFIESEMARHAENASTVSVAKPNTALLNQFFRDGLNSYAAAG